MSETITENKNIVDQNEESESSNSYILNASCVEVKLEIELKEGDQAFPNEFHSDSREIYQNFNPYTIYFNAPPNYSQTGMHVWNCDPKPLTNIKDVAFLQHEKNDIQGYDYFRNTLCDSSKETTGPEQQISESTSSAVEPFLIDNSSTSQTCISSQFEKTSDSVSHCKRWKPTDAEKKRVYRNRIKDENPDLWSDMKRKERCRKREQREEKRVILFEMQKTQALIAESETSEVEYHKAHLQRLRDRYPDVWIQFANDMVSIKNSFPKNSDNSQKNQWLTEAEKKRFYRKRIKEENPELWSAIKMKDACKKREQREEKRQILLEMRKTQELISNADPAEVDDHKAHLESLKEKYPDLWIQLEDAIAATQMRNRMLMLDSNQRSKRTTKPVQMYKDVIEAHKKYVYRQRLKEERPEYYAQMKARDAYKKSLKRMMLKKGLYSVNGGFDFSAISTESNAFSINVGYNIIDGYNITAESSEYNIIAENHGYAITADSGAYTTSPEGSKLDVNG